MATHPIPNKENQLGEHRDPITGAPGSHPVGTGVGAASGGAAGLAVGAAIGSVVPGAGTIIGGVVGAAVGAVSGGLAGKSVAESVNPTLEEAYWRDNHSSRPYAGGAAYDEYAPAYRYGWEARSQFEGQEFDDVETHLARDWESRRGSSQLAWEKARQATRDAWQRVQRAMPRDRDRKNP